MNERGEKFLSLGNTKRKLMGSGMNNAEEAQLTKNKGAKKRRNAERTTDGRRVLLTTTFLRVGTKVKGKVKDAGVLFKKKMDKSRTGLRKADFEWLLKIH